MLREPDASVFVAKLDDDKGLYIHISQVTGDDRGALSDQLKALSKPIAAGSLRYAILDLRFNGGGDYTETLDFTKELPKRIASDGKLFLLTDNATFSAALVTLARAKYFAGSRAVVLGERVGDRERFWAEAGTPLELPNSKIDGLLRHRLPRLERGLRLEGLGALLLAELRVRRAGRRPRAEVAAGVALRRLPARRRHRVRGSAAPGAQLGSRGQPQLRG